MEKEQNSNNNPKKEAWEHTSRNKKNGHLSCGSFYSLSLFLSVLFFLILDGRRLQRGQRRHRKQSIKFKELHRQFSPTLKAGEGGLVAHDFHEAGYLAVPALQSEEPAAEEQHELRE